MYELHNQMTPEEGQAILEHLATMASGTAAEPIAGWGGLLSGNPDNVDKIRQALTYTPRGELTQQQQQGMGQFLSPYAEMADAPNKFLGEIGYNLAGPVGGAIGRTAIPGLLSALGVRQYRGPRKPNRKDYSKYDEVIEEEYAPVEDIIMDDFIEDPNADIIMDEFIKELHTRSDQAPVSTPAPAISDDFLASLGDVMEEAKALGADAPKAQSMAERIKAFRGDVTHAPEQQVPFANEVADLTNAKPVERPKAFNTKTLPKNHRPKYTPTFHGINEYRPNMSDEWQLTGKSIDGTRMDAGFKTDGEGTVMMKGISAQEPHKARKGEVTNLLVTGMRDAGVKPSKKLIMPNVINTPTIEQITKRFGDDWDVIEGDDAKDFVMSKVGKNVVESFGNKVKDYRYKKNKMGNVVLEIDVAPKGSK